MSDSTLRYIAVGLLVYSTIYCLVTFTAIWAATSRRHWFWRALGWITSLLAFVPAHADEPLLFFLLQTLVLIGTLSFFRWRNLRSQRATLPDSTPPPRVQFSLQDVLLLMAIIGLALVVVTSISLKRFRSSWSDVAVSAVLSAAMASMVFWLVSSTTKRQAALRFVVVFLGLIATKTAWEQIDWLGTELSEYIVNDFLSSTYRTGFPAYFAHVCLLLFIGIVRLVSARRDGELRPRWQRWAKRTFFTAVGVILFFPTFVVYFHAVQPLPDFPLNSPEPNGYLELQKIEAEVPANIIPDPKVATVQEITTFFEKFESTYDKLQPTLDMPSSVPATQEGKLEFNTNLDFGHTALWLFLLKARVAEAEDKYGVAVEHYLNSLRIANTKSRGGLFIEFLGARRIVASVRMQIAAIRKKLSAEECRRTITEYQQRLAELEPMESIFERDRNFEAIAYGWRSAFNRSLQRITYGQETSNWDNYSWLQFRNETTNRLFLIELALQAFYEEQGTYPTALNELAPEYLTTLPLDPWRQKPFAYRLQSQNEFTLYSFGQDGDDDGGVIGPDVPIYDESDRSGDWTLDSLTGPNP